MSRHTYATNDEEEDLALSLALAASLSEDGPSEPAAANGNHWPSSAPAQQSQQQSQRPQQQQQQPPQQQPLRPCQPHQQQRQQQPNTAGNSSSGNSNGLQSLLQKPLKLLDSGLQKLSSDSAGIRCAGCGKWLGMAAVVRALGKEWHPGCFRCAGCQQPLMSNGYNNTFAIGTDQLPYHPECHKRLFHPICCVCHRYIPTRPDGRTEWRENPFWGNRHCPRHSNDGTPQCCSCSRLQPQGEEWVGLQDGRLLCLECLDTLVIDTKAAQPLYHEVLSFFNYMGMPHPYKAPLLLVEGPVLDDYAHKEGRRQDPGAGPVFHVRGLCVAHVHTTIPSVVRAVAGVASISSITTRLAPQFPQQQHCSVSVILVMYGLPRLLTGSIIAHELMHAYLRMRHVTGLPLQVKLQLDIINCAVACIGNQYTVQCKANGLLIAKPALSMELLYRYKEVSAALCTSVSRTGAGCRGVACSVFSGAAKRQ
eukprot:GHRR01009613.1.p1 GENE.GHRR01009613.1~~GHRR01009613.1.p1  ORF type:complete len:478 (+),score=126.42 GHRR01009613.1:326-1759(+)